jgi:superfamily II DNA helicase RecQ
MNRTAVTANVDKLIESGLLALDEAGEYRLVVLTPRGLAALAGPDAILRLPRSPKRKAGPGEPPSGTAADRFEVLRQWRLRTAQEQKVPPYVVFHDRALQAIAQTDPSTIGDLLSLPGVGPVKAANYGAAIMELLRALRAGDDAP